MPQAPRPDSLSNHSPSPQQRALQQRARRTRWLAAMTVDPVARGELMSYAEELDRQADALGDADSVPPVAASARDDRRGAG